MAHLFLEAPDWDQAALDRAKSLYISHYRSLEKSLERASADRVMNAMLGPDRCATCCSRCSLRSTTKNMLKEIQYHAEVYADVHGYTVVVVGRCHYHGLILVASENCARIAMCSQASIFSSGRP